LIEFEKIRRAILQATVDFKKWKRQRARMPALPAAITRFTSSLSLRKYFLTRLIASIIFISVTFAQSAAQSAKTDAIDQARTCVEEIRKASYPELLQSNIKVKPFRSRSDYFQSSFGIFQFFFYPKMLYIVRANPAAFELQAPDTGIKAIVAHELAHTFYYKRGNRLRLFGLIRLLSKGFTARFERWADLQSISRGYGEGLKEYRMWLYRNVPAEKLTEKKRNYFSPEEIDAIISAVRKRPELMNYWLKDVPRNLEEILADEKRYEAKPGSRQ
jgi:hypothetical protein